MLKRIFISFNTNIIFLLRIILFIFLVCFCFLSCKHNRYGREQEKDNFDITKRGIYVAHGSELHLNPDSTFWMSRNSGYTSGIYYDFSDTGRFKVIGDTIFFSSINVPEKYFLDTTINESSYSPYFENYVADSTDLLLHNSKVGATLYNIYVYKNSTLFWRVDSLQADERKYYKIPLDKNSEKDTISITMNKLKKKYAASKELKLRFYVDTIFARKKIVNYLFIDKGKIRWDTDNYYRRYKCMTLD